jgi:hypothetical protein
MGDHPMHQPPLTSTVPTAVEGSMGVNRKWFTGDTMTTSNLSVSITCTAKQQAGWWVGAGLMRTVNG